ncbi:MAG: peptide ABC transporter substrate-binding protein [Pseudomonadota bacterium]
MSLTKSTNWPSAVALLIAVSVFGCSSDGSDSEKVFVRASDSNPTTLMPNLVYETGGTEIARDAYEGLMAMGSNGKLQLGTAANFEVTNGGRTYVFEIREDAKWSNGDSVTAEDYVRGIRFAANPYNSARQANLLSPLANYQAVREGSASLSDLGVKALSAREIQFDLEYPAPYLLAILENPLAYPLHASAENTGNTQEPVPTNGAYTFSNVRPGIDIELRKNPNYYAADSVKIQKVRYVLSQDQTAVFNQFRSGSIHLTASVPTSLIEIARQLENGTYYESPQLAVYYYAFNTSQPPLDDIRARRALDIAVDRNQLVSLVLASGQLPATAPVPPYTPGFEQFERDTKFYGSETAIAEAQSLFRELGYSDDRKMAIRLLFNTGSDHRRIAQYVASEWESSLPVEVELWNQEFRVLLDTHKDKSAWEVIRSSWSADIPDAENFLTIFSSNSENNISGVRSSVFDDQLAKAHRETDPNRRNQIFLEAENTLLSEHANLFLYYYSDRRLLSKSVTEFAPNPIGVIRTQHLGWSTF